MNSYRFGILYAVLSFIPLQAFALQEFTAKDGDTIAIKISARELTRIAVVDGRIEKYWGNTNDLEVEADKERGEIFIKPTDFAAPAISFFIRDDAGSTYTVIAQQQNVPSETVLVKPLKTKVAQAINSDLKSQPFVEKVKRLLKGMALSAPVGGYNYTDTETIVPLWAETKITLLRTYNGSEFSGDIYKLQNLTTEKLILHENEFMDFGANVKAVAIESLELLQNEATLIYIVRQKEGATR